MKIRKIIATLLAMCMIFSCMGVIPAKAASEVDVTNDITMENRGTGWSSDTTYIKIGFGGRSTIETKAGSTYYVNDHADQATIDPAEYIYVNDKSVRSHISGYTGSAIGTNFPMNLGTLYNPICMYVDSTSIKIYVLNSYLTNGTFSVTVKGGFTWENTSGEVLSVKEDVTFGYASGAWAKQDEPTTGPSEGPSEDGSIDVTDLIAMKDTGTAYSADTTSIEVSFGDYSVTEASVGESYYVNTHGQDTPLDPAEYFYINDKSIRDHINDYSDKTTLGSAFPMSEDIRYNPICMYVSNGSKCFKLYVLDSYLEKGSYSITVKAGFRWTNVNGETLVVNKDVTYHYANGELVKLGEEPKEIDVTDEVFMNDFGTIISSDTTTISISLGEHKVAPASGDGTYCPNDHPTTNGVDVAEYILVNGQSVRSHLKTYEESGSDIRGSAFPMSAGIKYNPILVYCDADSNFFRISILTSYFPYGEFDVVLKSGFTWKNVDGKQLVVKKNVTFSYVDGVFQKDDRASVRDVTDSVVMKDAGSGISSDTTTITISPSSYDMTPASGESTYCVNDHAGTNGIDVAQYILVNGKSVRDHIGDYKGTVLGTAFPMNLGAQYNPILVYCEAESGYFRISILNSYLEKGTYEVTLKKGFTWNTSSGDVLVVKRNVTYAYHNGGFQKVGRTLLDFEDATAENAGTKLGAVENAYSAPVFEVIEEGTDSLKGAKVEWAYDGSKKVYMHTFKNGEWAEGFLEDADSYPYFRMWVYNPSHIYIDMSLALDNDVTSNYYDMSKAKLIKKDGQQITAEIGGEGGIRIPKQFEGWVVLPLDVAYLKATEGYDTVMTAFKEAKDVTIETRRVEVSENTGDAYILDEMVLDYMVVGEVKSTQDDTDYGKFDVSEKGEASLKNIIFMIGDGMGDGSLDAARLERETLYLDSLQRYGYIGTNEANDELTDSAAAGTALSTGYKTLNGKVGLTPDGTPVMNLSEWMLQFGKKVGLVTSSYLADATPATFAAHTDSRGNYASIAKDMVDLDLDLIMGGGTGQFGSTLTDEEGNTVTGIEYAKNDGYQYVTTKAEMQQITSGKVLGLFSRDAMNYRNARPSTEPNLAEMTETALGFLKNEKGFFVMIEGGNIDHANHANEGINTISETVEFDDAVKVAMDYVDAHEDTLLIITADHETGGVRVVDGKVTFSTTNHTTEKVPYYVYGKGAEYFVGLTDNTQIPAAIKAATTAGQNTGASTVLDADALAEIDFAEVEKNEQSVTFTAKKTLGNLSVNDSAAKYAIIRYRNENPGLYGRINDVVIPYAKDGKWHVSDVILLEAKDAHVFEPMSYIKDGSYSSIELEGTQIEIGYVAFFDTYEAAAACQANTMLTGEVPGEMAGDVHKCSGTKTDAVDATCTEPGNIAYWTCACGKIYADAQCTNEITLEDTVCDVVEHTSIHFDAAEPGCHSIGNVEYWYCADCEGFWTDEALTRVTNSKSVILPATGSDNLKHVEAKASTCKAEGNVEYWYCADCEGFWLDEACTRVTNSKSVILPKAEHKIVTVKGKPATTTSTGLTDGKKCSVCGEWTVKQQTIAKIAKPGKSAVSKLTGAKKKITVKFKKVSGVNGYEIQYATKKNMKGAKTVTVAASKSSQAIKKLKAKTKYFVRIRTYKVVNGAKVYSDWSNKKSVKTK